MGHLSSNRGDLVLDVLDLGGVGVVLEENDVFLVGHFQMACCGQKSLVEERRHVVLQWRYRYHCCIRVWVGLLL